MSAAPNITRRETSVPIHRHDQDRSRLHTGRLSLAGAALVAALLPMALSVSPASAALGDLDTTFDTDGKVTTDFGAATAEAANAMAVQADGKAVVAGSTTSGGGDFAVARYGVNGSLDTTFDTDGKVTVDIGSGTADVATAVAIQADGKIVVAGNTSSGGGDLVVVRLTPTGALDTTFDTDGKVTIDVGSSSVDAAVALAVQADGRIVVAGTTSSAGGDFAVVRLTATGSLDPTFDTDGKVTVDIGSTSVDAAAGLALQADGKIVVAGTTGAGAGNFAVVRITATGSLDATFDTDGKVTTDIGTVSIDAAAAVAVQADGRIVVAGTTGAGDFAVVRYSATGALDTTLDTDGKVTTDIGTVSVDAANAVAVQPDGKIVVVGSTSSSGGDFAVVRYDASGALDVSFSGDGKLVTDIGAATADVARAVALQAGKILVAGTTSLNGGDFALVRVEGDVGGTITDVTVTEGDAGTTNAVFSVTLSAAATVPVSIQYATADVTATAGVDYAASAGTITFAVGETLKSITVPVVGDTNVEPDETFLVNLTNATNLGTLDVSGTATITNDDVLVAAPAQVGYWLVAADGGIFSFGPPFLGSTGSLTLNKPIVGMAATPSGKGYWLVASDGGIFAFGDAKFFGSTGALKLNQPIVGMASTPSGNGYWLVASDGGIFAFGDASFKGSTGALKLNKPIVGMASSPSGNGYWLDASDGGIFAFGDATFFGSTGALTLSKPMVAVTATPSGKGYWLVASDGGVFAFGDAVFFGSTGALKLNQPVRGMESTPSGKGYWLVATDGGIFAFGDAVFKGSTGAIHLNQPMVGMAAP
ncbi:MAG TPA: Calx-beta domain-containing protein [Acidimicrobiales bacterium]|nr:Calx-beta domain-containing protein [Acidimicrobiales bacterium]